MSAFLIRRSRYGLALQSIGEYEEAAAHSGINVVRTKVITFAVSAVFMGMAGAIIATRRTYIDPGIAFNLNHSFLPVLMAMFGGMAQSGRPGDRRRPFHVHRGVLAHPVPGSVHAHLRRGADPGHLFMPNGILGLVQQALAQDQRRSTCTCLKVKASLRHFGGLAAVSEVDFYVDQGEILGLIGPNGAGKTTLFNLISASLKPTSGKITFKGRDITPLPAYKICRLGIARTFQTVKIFPHVPVVRNVMVGALFGTGQRIERGGGAARRRRKRSSSWICSLSRTSRPEISLWPIRSVSRWPGRWPREPELLLLDELMAGLTRPR